MNHTKSTPEAGTYQLVLSEGVMIVVVVVMVMSVGFVQVQPHLYNCSSAV